VLAGLRSVMVPGWGELATTPSRSAWTLVLISLVTANVAVGTLVVRGPAAVASSLFDPRVLLALAALNLLVAVARLVSTENAWRLAGGKSVMVALLLAALVLGPHLAVGWVTFQVRHTLVTVFAVAPPAPRPEPVIVLVPPSTVGSVPTTSPSPTPILIGSPGRTIPAASVDTGSGVGAAKGPLPPRLNLLLLGGDAGPGRSGLRTDSVIVMSVDTRTGDTALFGLPRNLGGLRLSDGAEVPGRILNEVYGWGARQPGRFPGVDPGAVAVAGVAEYLTGLKIDHFVLVDLTGFAELVDALGGVQVKVPSAVDGPLYNPGDGSYRMIRIPAGDQALNGGEALAYARARYGSNDYVRMGRQRCLLAAMADRAEPFRLFSRLPTLLALTERHVATDIPVDVLPELVRLGTRIADAEIRMVGFGPEWSLGVNDRGQLLPAVDRIREEVGRTLRDPSGSSIPTAKAVCG
jgi:polyisoprenyl-teichoic acid--peptidoglycan teichoic acid transferase